MDALTAQVNALSIQVADLALQVTTLDATVSGMIAVPDLDYDLGDIADIIPDDIPMGDDDGGGDGITAELDHFWLFFGGVMVFFMQAGFALLEVGSVRSKNTKNILLKNVMDAGIGALIWWSFGYPIAYGGDNEFAGDDYFFMAAEPFEPDAWGTADNLFADWFFQWAFAATAATIVSGAVAERCTFVGYCCYTCVITMIIYPLVVHWTWGGGWIATELGDAGYCDYAGSGIVHMTGGAAALAGAIVIGPRIGRFEGGQTVDLPGQNSVLSVLGTLILWFGWYGFNPVSSLALTGGGMFEAERVAVCTTLAAAGGCVCTFFMNYGLTKQLDIGAACNGILAGLVGITAGPHCVHPWAAVFIGFVAGPVYIGSSKMLKMLKIDDPLDASPVHLFCGAWGVFAAGLFHTTDGIFYLEGEHDDLLGIQVGMIVIIFGFVFFTSLGMFLLIKLTGNLRVPPEVEEDGMDVSKHGGTAYPDIALMNK